MFGEIIGKTCPALFVATCLALVLQSRETSADLGKHNLLRATFKTK